LVGVGVVGGGVVGGVGGWGFFCVGCCVLGGVGVVVWFGFFQGVIRRKLMLYIAVLEEKEYTSHSDGRTYTDLRPDKRKISGTA